MLPDLWATNLGNNQATNIGKKVELGTKKEKDKSAKTQQKQAFMKQKKDSYFPIQNLQNNLSKIKKDKPVITCCASGMRSASAKSVLKSNGYTDVHNGGGWMSLQNKIE